MNHKPELEPFLVQFSNEIDLTVQLELHETRHKKIEDETTDDD